MLAAAMSKNSEPLLAGYEAWIRDDRDPWLELLRPEAEIRTSGVFPDLAPRLPRPGAGREVQLREPWEVLRIDVEQIEEEVIALRRESDSARGASTSEDRPVCLDSLPGAPPARAAADPRAPTRGLEGSVRLAFEVPHPA
jgi:hypothetical protein